MSTQVEGAREGGAITWKLVGGALAAILLSLCAAVGSHFARRIDDVERQCRDDIQAIRRDRQSDREQVVALQGDVRALTKAVDAQVVALGRIDAKLDEALKVRRR